jgi:hypothetical protein
MDLPSQHCPSCLRVVRPDSMATVHGTRDLTPTAATEPTPQSGVEYNYSDARKARASCWRHHSLTLYVLLPFFFTDRIPSDISIIVALLPLAPTRSPPTIVDAALQYRPTWDLVANALRSL